jgi:hypothetical protein
MVVANRLQLDDGRCGSPGIESWLPMPSKKQPSPRSCFRTHHNRYAKRLADHEVLDHSGARGQLHRRVLDQLLCYEGSAFCQKPVTSEEISGLRILDGTLCELVLAVLPS